MITLIHPKFKISETLYLVLITKQLIKNGDEAQIHEEGRQEGCPEEGHEEVHEEASRHEEVNFFNEISTKH